MKGFFEGGGGQMIFRENGEWNQSSPTEYKEETIEPTSQLTTIERRIR